MTRGMRFLSASLLGTLLAFPGDIVRAGLLIEDAGTLRVLLVDSGVNGRNNVAPLAEALSRTFGASAIDIVVAKETTAERIETSLKALAEAGNPTDHALVFLALPLLSDGKENILVPADFDAERVWSGLPLRSMFATLSASAATVWLVYPSCFPHGGASPQQTSPRGFATIGYCATEVETAKVVDAFVKSLEGAAASALLESSPSQSATREVVYNEDVARFLEVHLQEAIGPSAARRRLTSTSGYSGLYVTPRSGRRLPSALIKEMLATTTIPVNPGELIAQWARAYRAGRVDGASLARDLEQLALDKRFSESATLAVKALGDVAPEETQSAMSRICLESDDPAVRRECVLQFPPPLPDVVLNAALASPHTPVRSAVFERALLRKDAAFAIPARDAALHDADPQIRIMALRATTAVAQPEEALGVVLAVLESDPPAELRQEAIIALGGLPKTSGALARLVEALQSSDPALQLPAAYALSSTEPSALGEFRAPIVRGLSGLVPDKNESLGLAALKTAGRLRLQELMPAILDIISDASQSVPLRRAASDAAGELAARESVPALIAVACDVADTSCDSPPALRVSALSALGRIPDARAVDTLWRALDAKDPELARAAYTALEGATVATKSVESALAPQTPLERRRLAARILSQSTGSTKALLKAIGDEDRTVREFAIVGLAKRASAGLVTQLKGIALRSSDLYTRAAVAEVLGRMGEVDAVSALANQIEGPRDFAVAGVIHASPEDRARYDVEQVIGWVKQSELAVTRASATLVLGDFSRSSSAEDRQLARKALESMAVDDPEASVREAAAARLRFEEARND